VGVEGLIEFTPSHLAVDGTGGGGVNFEQPGNGFVKLLVLIHDSDNPRGE
jgi:hypothetical protein